MKKLLLLVLILTGAVSQAQEKVKGNREPSTIITDVTNFNIIEIGGDYEVAIVEGITSQVEITTDSNLHEYLELSVVDSTFTINSTARIRSKKEMSIRLIYPAGLTKIIAKEKAEISSITELKANELEIEVRDDAKVFFTANINYLTLNMKGDSKAELNLRGSDANINFSDKASAKALLKYGDLKLKMTDRTNAKIEGDVDLGNLTLENKASFKGENLVFSDLVMTVTQNSDAEVNVKDKLQLSATDDTKVQLFNTAQVELEKFAGKTQLLKK